MRESLLKQMTWEDVREIRTTNPGGLFKSDEQFHKAVLSFLRNKHHTIVPIEERFPGVLACAELACGQPLTDTRERGNTIIRQFVAYRLHNEGYSYSEIGKVMNRDHSTITHLANRMRDMLSVPYAYRTEVSQFKEFDKLIGKENPRWP